MKIRRIIKDDVPISIFDLCTIGKDHRQSKYVTTTEIKNIYTEYKEDMNSVHTHDSYFLSWITSGECTYHLDSSSFIIKPNTIILLRPGEIHQFTDVKDLDGINFYFSSEVLANMSYNMSVQIEMELFTKNHIIYVSSETTKEMLKACTSHLCSICKDSFDAPFGQEILKLEMLIFLLKLLGSEEVQNSIGTRDINKNSHQIYLRFQKMVDEKYQTIHKVQEYSELLNISSKHLTECVRKNVRKTPLQIINQRLVLQSQRLLLFSRLRIKEIAFNLGFIDTSHFVKFFKKETHQSLS